MTCPCERCKRLMTCSANFIHPWCKKYEEWLKERDGNEELYGKFYSNMVQEIQRVTEGALQK